MSDYFFDKDCPSYSTGTGTTEHWKSMYDFEKKQNTMFRGDLSILEAERDQLKKLLKEAVYCMADAQGSYRRMEHYNGIAFCSIEKFRDNPEIKKILSEE